LRREFITYEIYLNKKERKGYKKIPKDGIMTIFELPEKSSNVLCPPIFSRKHEHHTAENITTYVHKQERKDSNGRNQKSYWKKRENCDHTLATSSIFFIAMIPLTGR
jgi:hypothetical protein